MTFSHVNLLHSLVIYSSVFGNLTLDVHHCSLFLWLSCSKILSSSITIKSICKSSLPTVMDIICLFIYVLYLSWFFFFFVVTLDYKALTMLIKRKDNGTESVETLCQRGLDTECCIFCKVIRVGYYYRTSRIRIPHYRVVTYMYTV